MGQIIETVPLVSLKPATINNVVYKPVRLDDPSIVKLGKSIAKKGLLEAIVVTLDDVIVSGHRRRSGCILAKLVMVPVRRINIFSTDPRFPEYLVEFNTQRVKSRQEMLREEVARTSPEDARTALMAHRKVADAKEYRRLQDTGLRILPEGRAAHRSEISDDKRPMLEAALGVIGKYKTYWPLTLRQIHYRLLTCYVLRNTRTGLKYENNLASYKDLSDLLTRARNGGVVPWESMHDPTRPRTSWIQYEDVGEYFREQMDEVFSGYKRNLLQSQPWHVELVVEKLAVYDIAKRAASSYHVPVGVGKGYTSVTTLEDTAERSRASGKDRFILLIAGDFDPEGENIPEVWGNCLRDEHGIDNLTCIKVGVNPDHIDQYELKPLPMKATSSRADGFAAAHGSNVYELEAFEPAELQGIISHSIKTVLDMRLFAEEQRRESEDARFVLAARKQICELLKGFRTSPEDGDGGDE